MPSVQNILSSNRKRLDITDYCKDIMSEGETEVFIVIKKTTKILKTKMQLLAYENIDNKSSKALSKAIADNGLTLKDIDAYQNKTLNDPEKEKTILKVFLDADIDIEGKIKLTKYQNEIEKVIFAECIDKADHNFDDNGKKIDISNYEFWNKLGKDNLILFIMDEIKKFSEDFLLIPNGGSGSDGQSAT
jgi:hypothetical protein